MPDPQGWIPQAVVEKVVQTLKIPFDESKAKIEISTLPPVIGDEVQIGQLFQNLISNALKYRRIGPPRISISARQTQCGLTFSVADNGIGFDMRFATRVFEIFQRLHGRDKYPGTGIGLAICKKIVERHGGKIWVESKPEVGSTFYFTLTVDPNMLRPLGGMKILLVDDARDIQMLVGKELRLSGGAIVDIAKNGKEGVKMAMQGTYDVVLMDIQMPLQNGFEATSVLRQSGFQKPIIAFTSFARTGDGFSEGNGFSDYLNKACDVSAIIGKLIQYRSLSA